MKKQPPGTVQSQPCKCNRYPWLSTWLDWGQKSTLLGVSECGQQPSKRLEPRWHKREKQEASWRNSSTFIFISPPQAKFTMESPWGKYKGAGFVIQKCHSVLKFALSISQSIFYDWNSCLVLTRIQDEEIWWQSLSERAWYPWVRVDLILCHPQKMLEHKGLLYVCCCPD